MEDRGWRIVDRGWRIEDGRWRMEGGRWKVELRCHAPSSIFDPPSSSPNLSHPHSNAGTGEILLDCDSPIR
jgi:hypothetical protein